METAIELPLVLLAGVLGSAHCIGMCGPFALAIGGHTRRVKGHLAIQLIYSSGRICTYAAIGATAGYGGVRVASFAPSVVNVPAVLALAAGVFLLYQGLAITGVLARLNPLIRKPRDEANHLPSRPASGTGLCLGGTFVASFLREPGGLNAFLAGLFTGMLPCGLVYAFAALAASSLSVLRGAAVMAAFGLGTVPVMVATGIGGSLLGMTSRRYIYQIAAWCVVLAGIISMARGMSYLSIPGWESGASCPVCSSPAG